LWRLHGAVLRGDTSAVSDIASQAADQYESAVAAKFITPLRATSCLVALATSLSPSATSLDNVRNGHGQAHQTHENTHGHQTSGNSRTHDRQGRDRNSHAQDVRSKARQQANKNRSAEQDLLRRAWDVAAAAGDAVLDHRHVYRDGSSLAQHPPSSADDDDESNSARLPSNSIAPDGLHSAMPHSSVSSDSMRIDDGNGDGNGNIDGDSNGDGDGNGNIDGDSNGNGNGDGDGNGNVDGDSNGNADTHGEAQRRARDHSQHFGRSLREELSARLLTPSDSDNVHVHQEL